MMFANVPRSTSTIVERPVSSMFRDKNLLYVQPERPRPMVYTVPYKKPTLKIESDTIYGLSYKFYCPPGPDINYGKHLKTPVAKTGSFDFDTVYKLSFMPATAEIRTPIVPKSRLSIHGVHDMTTTHKASYMNPGSVKTRSCKPLPTMKIAMPMESRTVTKESYQAFGGPIEVTRPRKRQFWQTKFKTDYLTTSQMSYQYVKPLSKRIRVRYRPTISSKIDSDTVYNTSYRIPGSFVPKGNVATE